MALPLTRPSYGGIKYQPLLHSAQVRRRQAAIPHSGCDRSPVRQLHLTTRVAPGLPPAWEGVRRRHVPLKEGRSSLAARGPDLPLEGSGTST